MIHVLLGTLWITAQDVSVGVVIEIAPHPSHGVGIAHDGASPGICVELVVDVV